MSESSGPTPAHAEEFDEETQEAIPGTKQSADVKTKRSKRDGDSSRVAVTQNTSSSSKLLSMVGLKKASKSTKSPVKAGSKNAPVKVKQSLKIDTNVESQQAASRISLSGIQPPPMVRRLSSTRSAETAPRLSGITRQTATGIHHVIPVRIPQSTRSGIHRPSSIHGSLPGFGFPLVYTSTPVSSSPYIPMPPPPPPPPPPQQPMYQHPPHPTAYITPTPTSPGRQTAYPFPATLPPQYMTPPQQPPWDSPYHSHYVPPPAPAPAVLRRFSIAGHPPPIVEYPTVPSRPAFQHFEHSRPPSAYHSSHGGYAIDDGPLLMNNHEAYYLRHQEQARLAMPPPPVPQRPMLKHAATTSDSIRRSNRNSLESIPRRSTSSRHESFGSQREEAKAPLMERSSSSRNGVNRAPPSSPDSPRKSRPQSYHAGLESSRRQSLTTDAVRKVESASRATKTKTSESGAKSEITRKVNDTKKRTESRQRLSSNDAVHVEVDPGCAATVIRDAKGYSVHVRSTDDQASRSGRQSEKEDGDRRRYSVSSRRESSSVMEALARSITTRRPSSSHPVNRRPRIEQVVPELTTKRITDYKVRDVDETAVEDDDYSEPDTRKKRNDKLAGQRVQRLKKTSESRQSSRDNRSVKSSRSTRSTTSSRRGLHHEGEFF